ncbi:MAG: PEGA domain-containing protein, partial [Candidatus Nealsonbacteria bacterium]|nr:PEGA domain-containing protein [Candidatus Nealsonbacteria bacterium]
MFYSQGYRFDFEKRKITQTGAIFLQAEPKRAEVYINGKFSKKTDLLSGSALLENLLPGEYKIKLKRDGYYLWDKTLEVKEKQVTEAKNIILVKDKINFTTLPENAKNLWPAEQKTGPQNILIAFGDYTFSKEGGTFYVFNNHSEKFEKIFEGIKDYKISPDNGKLMFFSESEIWIFYLKNKTEIPTKKAGERQFLVRLSEK